MILSIRTFQDWLEKLEKSVLLSYLSFIYLFSCAGDFLTEQASQAEEVANPDVVASPPLPPSREVEASSLVGSHDLHTDDSV